MAATAHDLFYLKTKQARMGQRNQSTAGHCGGV